MSGRVSHSTLEQVRQANDIVTVIGSYFNLQQRGSTFKALCPFHKEKTPSFIVNQERQIFHCFGCGAGGDVFRFIMDYEKVDFPTAIKMLARRAGIKLSFEDTGLSGKPGKDDLYALLESAAVLYHSILAKGKEAQAARRYLRSRGFEGQDVKEFMIGYAPGRWDTLLRWAGKKLSHEQLETAGLVIAHRPNPEESSARGKAQRYYDRFRDRIMFPVHDELGRVVGFSGRALSASDEGAKYINTPETIVFHKGRILYGLYKARRNIAKSREVIVCEGQLDVIRCHLAGFNTAVAPQGTAFTDGHAGILKRYADSALIVFDADDAGRNASLRAADILLQAGMAVRIAELPAGEDPDSMLERGKDKSAFKAALDRAKPALDFRIELLAAREKPGTEAGMLRIVSAVLEMIGKTPNAVQQDMLIERASNKLGVSQESLRRELRKKPGRARHQPEGERESAGNEEPEAPLREAALAEQLVVNPSLARFVQTYLPLNLLTNRQCQQIVESAIEASGKGEDVLKVISRKDTNERDLSRFAARLLAAAPKAKDGLSTDEERVKLLILGIRTDALKRRRKELEDAQSASSLTKARRTELQMEYYQLQYDIARLKDWDTAVPLMKNM